MAVPRTRPGQYPAILSYGFRPFFLFGALYGGIAILLWLPLLYGRMETASSFDPLDWHIHEMLFGYAAAIVTGFLLTAIPNWTGRLPVQGRSLLLLLLLWLGGRFAIFFSADIGWTLAALIDSSYLLAVAAAAGFEIVAGRNWRNLKVLIPVFLLFAANVVFHLEAHFSGTTDISRRLGVAAVIILIMIIGGRIIPSFTRNWLAREKPGRLPVPIGRFDVVTLVVSAVALVAWIVLPDHWASGWALVAAALLNTGRVLRWAGDRAARDPLVLILHVAWLFVPLGLLLTGLAALLPEYVAPVAGFHAFGAGAIGSITLAVMARATLGHTGRPLQAGAGGTIIFIAVVVSAILRVVAAFFPAVQPLLHASATAWIVAFLGYAVMFGPMLLRPRVQPRQPNRASA